MSQKYTDQDAKFMKRAIALSADACGGDHAPHGGPFGTIIVRDGKIVGRGFNRVLVNHDPTAHGEIVAIRAACKKLKTFDLTGCTLYTNAEPCPMCLAAAWWANIDKIFYAVGTSAADKIGFRDGEMYKQFKRPETGTQIKSEFVPAARAMLKWRAGCVNAVY